MFIDTGVCYGYNTMCDGISDCPEYSMEHYHCPHCQPGAHKCRGQTYCLAEAYVCDGHSDCPDGSDEKS